MWRNVQRWRGVILIGAAVVATLWLAVGNQLVLYIHPRYIVFTVIMAALAIIFVVASALRGQGDEDDDAPSRSTVVVSVAAVVAGVAVAVTMVALPPATLSSATAGQRDINGSTIAGAQSVTDVESAPVGAFAAFTVKDWASLLRQTTDLDFYKDKPVDVVGFITADPDDPQNVFYVSRFVVTCCAVDAQPLGVPVYLENWTDSFELDQWVEAKGELGTNPSQHSTQPLALDPDSITIVEQPSEPYLF